MQVTVESDGSPHRTYLRDAVSGKKLRLVQELTVNMGLHGAVLCFVQNGHESPLLPRPTGR